jgi:hypothetical protein
MLRPTHRSIFASLLAAAALAAMAAPASAGQRFFTVVAVEPKGGTTADKEPFPATPLPPGGGYVIKAPDPSGRWEVSAYVWQPSQIIVDQGDEVTIEFVGINGAHHPTTITGYDKSFVLKRGHTMRVSFTADKAGVFPIVCAMHKPSMVGELVVMAKK